MNRFTRILLLLVLSVGVRQSLLHAGDLDGVGLGQRMSVTIPGDRLKAAKVYDKDAARVRVVSTEKVKDGYQYELEFIGMEPGEHNLISYLRTSQDTVPELPEQMIQVSTSLPEVFTGELRFDDNASRDFYPWYRAMNNTLLVAWVIGIPLIILIGRKEIAKRKTPEIPELPLIEKIRALLRQMDETSDRHKWQRLEGMVYRHLYEEREMLKGLTMHEALQQLKRNEQEARVIEQMERGIHSEHELNGTGVRSMLNEVVGASSDDRSTSPASQEVNA